MTMPHLMNCPHSEDGWCLDCVKELWDNEPDSLLPNEKIMANFIMMCESSFTPDMWDDLMRVCSHLVKTKKKSLRNNSINRVLTHLGHGVLFDGEFYKSTETANHLENMRIREEIHND